MTNRPIPQRGTLLLTFVLAAVQAVPAPAKPQAAKKNAPNDAGPVTIRPKFEQGQLLRYALRLSGRTIWTPQIPGVDWGEMATEFTFTLHAKTPRPDGSWTFDLVGEYLRSAGQGSKGRIAVVASPQQSALKARGKHTLRVESPKSPLQHPMTLTIGPRGGLRFGTGLLPLAIHMLPHVDHRFWTLLTLAPDGPVSPGDQHELDLKLPVPGAEGTPLAVKAVWRVAGWEKLGSRDVLAITLAAKFDLADSDFLLANGDWIRVVKGSYVAAGKALWDVSAGLLSSATARQELLLTADRPVPRGLRSQAECSLRLLDVQNPQRH